MNIGLQIPMLNGFYYCKQLASMGDFNGFYCLLKTQSTTQVCRGKETPLLGVIWYHFATDRNLQKQLPLQCCEFFTKWVFLGINKRNYVTAENSFRHYLQEMERKDLDFFCSNVFSLCTSLSQAFPDEILVITLHILVYLHTYFIINV